MPAVAADDQIGADLQFAVRRLGAQPDNAPALLDQIRRLGAHAQIERRIALAARGQEVEEIPLRHQRDEFAVRRQMRKVGERDGVGADLTAETLDARMRQLQEFIEQAELVHQFERRGMDGVAAEIAQEVGVLFQHGDGDAGARQQKAEHHAGRSAAGDAAGGFDRRSHRTTNRLGERLVP